MINLNQLKIDFEVAQSGQGIMQPYYNHYYKVINRGRPQNHFERVISCIETMLLSYLDKVVFKAALNVLKKEIAFLNGGKKGLLAPGFVMPYGRRLAAWRKKLDTLSQKDLIIDLKESYEKYDYKNKSILNEVNTTILLAKRAAEERMHNSIKIKSEQRQTNILFNIPPDILLSILSTCDIKTIGLFTRICAFAYQHIKDADLFWKSHASNAIDKHHYFKTAFFKKYVISGEGNNVTVTVKASINDNSARHGTVSFRKACKDIYTEIREVRREHEKFEETRKSLEELSRLYQNRPHYRGVS